MNDAVTFEEMRALLEEMRCAPGGSSGFEIDGIWHGPTDAGYAIDGIEYFVEILERRHRKDDQRTRRERNDG